MVKKMRKKLYHGSDNTFNAFSLDYLGKNGTAQGSGVYLASNKDTAKMYGSVQYVVNVDLNNSLSLTDLTVKRGVLVSIITRLHNDHDLLNNFNDVSYYGVDYVLNEVVSDLLEYNDNDVDLYNDLVNSLGSAEEVAKAYSDYGSYTHIIAEDQTWTNDTVYIVLDPAIINIEKMEGSKMEHNKKQLSDKQLINIIQKLKYYTVDFDITITDIVKEYNKHMDEFEKEYNVKVKR